MGRLQKKKKSKTKGKAFKDLKPNESIMSELTVSGNIGTFNNLYVSNNINGLVLGNDVQHIGLKDGEPGVIEITRMGSEEPEYIHVGEGEVTINQSEEGVTLDIEYNKGFDIDDGRLMTYDEADMSMKWEDPEAKVEVNAEHEIDIDAAVKKITAELKAEDPTVVEKMETLGNALENAVHKFSVRGTKTGRIKAAEPEPELESYGDKVKGYGSWGQYRPYKWGPPDEASLEELMDDAPDEPSYQDDYEYFMDYAYERNPSLPGSEIVATGQSVDFMHDLAQYVGYENGEEMIADALEIDLDEAYEIDRTQQMVDNVIRYGRSLLESSGHPNKARSSNRGRCQSIW